MYLFNPEAAFTSAVALLNKFYYTGWILVYNFILFKKIKTFIGPALSDIFNNKQYAPSNAFLEYRVAAI